MRNPSTGRDAVVDEKTKILVSPDVVGDVRLLPLVVTPDQAGPSRDALNLCTYGEKLCIGVFPEESHDAWNDVKNSLKNCTWYAWGVVCMLSLVHNCWRMPYGTKAFSKVR